MKPLQISRTNEPTSKSAIASFSRAAGLSLPPEYEAFLLETNGGAPVLPVVYPITGMPRNPWGGVQYFCGLGAHYQTEDLAFALNLFRDSIPHLILPIGGNGGGDYLCLDLRSGQQKVVFWDNRHYWGTGEWREQDVYFVADSFAAFIASLRPRPS